MDRERLLISVQSESRRKPMGLETPDTHRSLGGTTERKSSKLLGTLHNRERISAGSRSGVLPCYRAQPFGRPCGEFNCAAYPTPALAGCWALGKHRDTAPRLGIVV